MGILKEIFSDMDEPALIIEFSKDDSDKKRLIEENNKLKGLLVSRKIDEIMLENNELKRQLNIKEMKFIR